MTKYFALCALFGSLLWGVQIARADALVRGDFNGDGRKDLAQVFDDYGYSSVEMFLSQGGKFAAKRRWATQQGGYWAAQKWLGGDFNGDGRTDLANVFNCGGYACIDVHLSNGSGFIAYQHWAGYQGGFWDAQQWFAGDFNGDGKDDLAKVFNDWGYASIDAHLSTGAGFYIQRWATQQGGYWEGQKWVAGDYNGDRRTDVANVFDCGGFACIDVHPSNGGSFGMQHWATQQGGFWNAQKWTAADFNGDGLDDLANTFNDQNLASSDIHVSNGSSFYKYERWATSLGGFWDQQRWTAGDFNGDGRADLANFFACNGQACADVHQSNGRFFVSYQHWIGRASTIPASELCNSKDDMLRPNGCLVATFGAPYGDAGTTQIRVKAYAAFGATSPSLQNVALVVPGYDILTGGNGARTKEWFEAFGVDTSLRSNGVDVLIADYGDRGNDYVQNNAMALVELIAKINSFRTSPNVPGISIVGVSMGGVVARYALSYMERYNIAHGVKTYISYDSPHQGANIPVGAQFLPQFFLDAFGKAKYRMDKMQEYASVASWLVGPLVTPLLGPEFVWLQNPTSNYYLGDLANEEIRQQFAAAGVDLTQANGILASVQSPAARQLLINHYQHHASDPSRYILQSELQLLGNYPAAPRRIAFTNGSVQGGSSEREPKLGQVYLDHAANVDTGISGSAPNDQIMNLHFRVTAQGAGEVQYGFMGGPIVDWKNTIFGRVPHIRYDVYYPQQSRYPNGGHVFLDNVPGGMAGTFGILQSAFNGSAGPFGPMRVNIGYHSFIPTYSAIDLPLGTFGLSAYADLASYAQTVGAPALAAITPFQRIYAATSQFNEVHTAITYLKAEKLVCEIRDTCPPPTN